MAYFFAFFAIVAVKFLINLAKLVSIRKLRDKYVASFAENAESFSESVPFAKRLIKDAGLGNAAIPVVEPLGYGKLASFNAKVVDNLCNRRSDFVGQALELFDQSIGVFRMRMLDSISPRYWIEFVIFLPRNFFRYLGYKGDGVVSKLFQVIYWIAAPLLVIFRENIYNYISILFSQT